ncbi:hypothetical protein [Methylocella sp. CPCC 101449]|uniref:hypothetical protein n=1 Tax=Methylocella sp. CPCC 101449 TaxID=2987531 RepID=UPI00288D97F4|nr:hypothetical protein [Methylocella sp. CPCC 101449]MDT2024603.1 hypothetical protein [Methylocella sp. CPCC 101449]
MRTELPRFRVAYCWPGQTIEITTTDARNAAGALMLALHRTRPDIADEISIQDAQGQELLRRRVQPVHPVGELLP